jgi:FMN reductase
MSILFIQGSPLEPSRSAALAQAVASVVADHDVPHDWLRVSALPAQALLHATFDDPAICEATARVAAADAIVIATPVYKAAYSGLLKAFLDLLPQNGLEGKVVLPLATAGSPHHALALDYALRPVLQSMSPAQVMSGVHATDGSLVKQADGRYALADDLVSRLHQAAERLLAEYRTRRIQPAQTSAAQGVFLRTGT